MVSNIIDKNISLFKKQQEIQKKLLNNGDRGIKSGEKVLKVSAKPINIEIIQTDRSKYEVLNQKFISKMKAKTK